MPTVPGNKPSLLQTNPRPTFIPSVMRGARQNEIQGFPFGKVALANQETDETSIGSTSSYFYDIDGAGLKSTQQLNIDWADFANHTFYNSAFSKTSTGIRNIIESLPFDGSQEEIENFVSTLTGWEKYLLDNMPQNKGYLWFDQSLATTFPVYVTTNDAAGAAYPTITRTPNAATPLNPGTTSSMCTEFWINIPSQSNTNQWLFRKFKQISSTNYQGFGVYASSSASPNSCSLVFLLESASYSLTSSLVVQKGSWQHCAWNWDRTQGNNFVSSFLSGVLQGQSSKIEFDYLKMDGEPLYLATGSQTLTFQPVGVFSGSMDELRIWHELRDNFDLTNYLRKPVVTTGLNGPLKLYYKFNEPSGSATPAVLDYSGNGLHGQLSTGGATTLQVRNVPTSSIAGESPMTSELLKNCTVIFPDYPPLQTFTSSLFYSASQYDMANPSLITKLVPPHLIQQGSWFEGLQEEENEVVGSTALDTYGSEPASITPAHVQILLSLLYSWATMFDELKLYTQAFSSLNKVGYALPDTVPDTFLQNLAARNGITLPPLFTGATIKQFIDGDNLQDTASVLVMSLKEIRNQIWRRILTNLPSILKSKGTTYSLKAFIRAVGIDPDNNFRFREYGGPSKRTLSSVSRETKNEVLSFLSFNAGNLSTYPLTGSGDILYGTSSFGYVSSSLLFSKNSRVEPGYPATSSIGSLADTLLLTSGSFGYEALYSSVTGSSGPFAAQSLARLSIGVPSSSVSGVSPGVFMLTNLVSTTPDNLTLYVNENGLATSSFSLSVSASVHDGRKWYISFGRQRNDDPSLGLSVANPSSSWWLRAYAVSPTLGGLNAGFVQGNTMFETSSFKQSYALGASTSSFSEHGGYGSDFFQRTSSSIFGQTSGPFIEIGSGSVVYGTGSFLNYFTASTTKTNTFFNGNVSRIKFYSKYLTLSESRQHALNIKSTGVEDAFNNWNFDTTTTGSFGRLRMDVTTDQPITSSDGTGAVVLFDFSQNNLHFTGSLFPTSSRVIFPAREYFSYLTPKFDDGVSDLKVRIRGYQQLDENGLGQSSYASVAPAYEIPDNEKPTDNSRFTIDFSVVDFLNEDIVSSMFSTFDNLETSIGKTSEMYEDTYKGLEVLSDLYFNRLTDKINLKSFFEFYKWFDNNIGTFLGQLLPRKTRFLGTRFVIESHMLERARVRYQSGEQYLVESQRSLQRQVSTSETFSGRNKKF